MIEIITGNAWQIVQKPEQLGTAFCANMTTVRTIAHAMKHARNRDAEYVWDTQTEIGIVVGIRRMKKLVKTASEMARLLEPQRTPSNIQGRFRIHPSFSHFYRGEYNLPASRKQLADKLRQAWAILSQACGQKMNISISWNRANGVQWNQVFGIIMPRHLPRLPAGENCSSPR